MPEKWTGRLVGRMHNERITNSELASEMGVTKSYISMILNGSRRPDGVRQRMESAVDAIVARRQGTESGFGTEIPEPDSASTEVG